MITGDISSVYLSTLEAFRSRDNKKKIDKQAFMMLLLTELKNQNPLEPLDNKDLIAQLTQLTSLEQISNMTKSVTDFVSASLSMQKAQAASMVGKNVVVRSNTVDLSNGRAEAIYFNVKEPAHLYVKIVDQNGRQVYFEDLGEVGSGIQSWVWNGKNSDGTAMPDGTYFYSVYKVNPDGSEEEIGGLEQGRVEAVQFVDGKIYILVNGQKYPVDSIVEISEEVDQA
jgi:flagellar basal-body rod modification protein FlgD